MSYFSNGKIGRFLRTLISIETLEALGISPAKAITTTEMQFVTTSDGEFVTDST